MTTADRPVDDPAAADSAFPVEFQPGDEAREWEWDDMHSPRAVPRLSQDYLRALSGGFQAGYDAVELPYSLDLRIWNGYPYFAFRIRAPEDEHAAIRAAAPERWRRLIPTTVDYWRTAREELVGMYREIDRVAGDEPADDLVDAWLRAWQHNARVWQIHFVVIAGPYQVLDDLADRYEAIVPGAGPADALELVAGTVSELRAADADLESLTATAAASPAVAARLRSSPRPTRAELAALPDAAPFLAALDRFLASHGHLGHMTEDLTEPSWAEDVRPLLGDVGRRLDADPRAAERRTAEREARARRHIETVRATLADRPDELAQFETLLATAREIGPLTEGHNYWIDRMCADRLRRLSRRVGRRLVTAGVMDDAEEVVHLHVDEIAELIREPADRRALIAQRTAEHERNLSLDAPRTVGRVTARDPNAPIDRFEGGHFGLEKDGSLRGTGASAGVVRGAARIVLGADDFDKVAPGDIVVATASNPGWVPLFGIAGGIVTDTGGVVSHAAVVAREFGIPAVVGTRLGTKRIRDGSTVEVDGTTGIVRLG